MITYFLAHAGEVHETAAEAAQHSAQDPMILWLVLLMIPFVIAFFSHVLLKQKVTVILLANAVFLIFFSIYSYQSPGLYTVVSLVVGFVLTFALAFAGLTARE